MEIPTKHENQTSAQAIIELGPEQLAVLAAEQGYANPGKKAEDMYTAAQERRKAELAKLFERDIRIGETALVFVNNKPTPATEFNTDMAAGRKI